MPAPPVFGRLDKDEQLNLEPFKFSVAAYKQDDDGTQHEVTYEFTASGIRPFYVQLDIVKAAASGNGLLSSDRVISFVEQSLLNDDERARFRDLLSQPDVFVKGEVLSQISDWLAETYSDRPTKPPTAKRGGRSRAGQRSMAAANGRG
ncbi:MAG TPA: hypothetical protein VGN13_12430 [Solirubrobacteraceae bacterium]|jgi:hypothetical protein